MTNSPNTYGLNTVSQLQALNVNSPLLAKNPTNGMFTLTVGVQRAPQLTNFALFPMSCGLLLGYLYCCGLTANITK